MTTTDAAKYAHAETYLQEAILLMIGAFPNSPVDPISYTHLHRQVSGTHRPVHQHYEMLLVSSPIDLTVSAYSLSWLVLIKLPSTVIRRPASRSISRDDYFRPCHKALAMT